MLKLWMKKTVLIHAYNVLINWKNYLRNLATNLLEFLWKRNGWLWLVEKLNITNSLTLCFMRLKQRKLKITVRFLDSLTLCMRLQTALAFDFHSHSLAHIETMKIWCLPILVRFPMSQWFWIVGLKLQRSLWWCLWHRRFHNLWRIGDALMQICLMLYCQLFCSWRRLRY